jgi:uncharacterized Zn-binding protein involved in type VI secretion
MTLPAARLGDSTVHGGVITVGAPTVLIGGKPAARIGDMHTCPMTTGPVPHVGGPIVLGAFTVLVSGPPQARVGDIAVCVGPPDSIAVGEPTVLVGMAPGGGMAGALGSAMGGMFAGVKSLFGSEPKAKLLPDGSVVTQYSDAIIIQGSAEYQATVVSDLNRLAVPLTSVDPATGKLVKTPSTGGKLLDALEGTGRRVTIQPIPASQTQANAFARADDLRNAVLMADETAGAGSDSTVLYNPSLSFDYRAEDGTVQTMPPHAILGHEMTHALHNANGENRRNLPDPIDPHDNQEEARTIGVHGFEREPISERGLSTEAGRSPRPNHDAVEGMTYKDASGAWQRMQQDPTGGWTTPSAPEPPTGDRPHQ